MSQNIQKITLQKPFYYQDQEITQGFRTLSTRVLTHFPDIAEKVKDQSLDINRNWMTRFFGKYAIENGEFLGFYERDLPFSEKPVLRSIHADIASHFGLFMYTEGNQRVICPTIALAPFFLKTFENRAITLETYEVLDRVLYSY